MNNNLYNELGTNFIEYAAAVNSDRSIPDAKSGLKPVARRIIWGAFNGGRTSNKPYVKNARIVGDVMGALHPHGDSSIYGALVRLSQGWVMRYPLIDFHGNQGTVTGDGPAASRYTEGRLSKLAEEGLLNGIKKFNVNFIPNYDETEDEPETLPSLFPNLLCNPNSGIGVAMACNWLPHNLNEVAEAIYQVMSGEEPTIPGPDFPTGGLIINGKDIPNILKTGHGSVKVRGKYKINKNEIIFYEIPYGTTVETLKNEIGTAADEKEIEGIVEVEDASDKKGAKIVITCTKTANLEHIVQQLFSKTNLQTSVSYNQIALVDKVPTELNLKDCIEVYIKHNIDCLIKETQFDLNKAKARLHIVGGLLIALEDIDNVIALIKKSENSSAAKESLIKKYNLDEIQAKSILAMRLSSLAHMEKIELENEKKELVDSISDMEDTLVNNTKQLLIIRTRLEALVKKFGDARRTEITNIEIPKEDKEIETVVPEDCVVILTQSGNIKRIPSKTFKVQKRNGKGVKSEDDTILDTISTNTIDTLMAFTNKGKMYRLIVDSVPVGTNVSKGVKIGSLINLEPGEIVMAITSLHRKTDAEYVVFITKGGLVKKTKLEEYTKVKRSTGIQAIKIKEGDSIANVTFLKDEDLILITHYGMSIHIETKNIAPIGRATSGIKGIKLGEGDTVVAGLPIHNQSDKVAVFTAEGFGKQTPISDFPVQNNNGKGVKCCVNSNIVGAAMLSPEDNILIIGTPNSICISSKDVPILGRTSVGNIMIKNSKILRTVKL